MNDSRKVTVTVDLAPLDVLLLQAISTHTGRTKDEVVADGLRLLFVAMPRPDDAPSTSREDESGFQHEASKPGDRP